MCDLQLAEIKKLTPQQGDILVMRLEHGCTPAALQHFSETLKENGISECVLLTIEDDSDMYILNEEAMNHLGWVKKVA